MDSDKPLLHSSMLETLEKCGVQFEYRYVKGIIIPPGVAMLTGSSVHDLQDAELTHKVETGKLFTAEQVRDTTRDAFERRWDEGVMLTREERELGLKHVKGETADLAVVLGELYHEQIAPDIIPRSKDHIEWPWILEMDGYPYNLAGTTDVISQNLFRDLKNLKTTPNQKAVDSSLQYTIYGLAFETFFGLPAKGIQDTIVKLKTPKVVQIETCRTETDYEVLYNHLERFSLILEKGVFTPASGNAWWCGPDWCGYTEICPYFRGHKQFSIGG
ncbi:MAG: PD-(D/E)XK nuclease family protein [Methylococcaceae bacterium]